MGETEISAGLGAERVSSTPTSLTMHLIGHKVLSVDCSRDYVVLKQNFACSVFCCHELIISIVLSCLGSIQLGLCLHFQK